MAPLSPLAPIDLQEAIKDSPRFRNSLAQHTGHLARVEQRINEILKLVAAMHDLGTTYSANFYKLSVCVNQLTDEAFAGHPMAAPAMRAISDAYSIWHRHSREFFETSTRDLTAKLSAFVKTELHRVSESRAHFDSMSSSMDDALTRNSASSKTKPSEGAEGRNALTAVSTCFAHTTLDYVSYINRAHAHKNHVVVDALWGLVCEYSSFFSRGHASFDEWTSDDKGAVADSVAALGSAAKLTERKMQDIHSMVSQESLSNPSGMSLDPDVVMEGYLYKRSTNALRKWNRRWFQIRDCKLLYSHRSSDAEMPTVMEENLMLCLVRPASASVDRPACFELVTPTKNHLLQADSEMQCNAWMRALQRTILHLHESHQKSGSSTLGSLASSSNGNGATGAGGGGGGGTTGGGGAANYYNGKSSPSNAPSGKLYEQLRRDLANRKCADCGAADPKWVSINLGALLCIECAGLHRSLGVHVSKVRSLTMDSFDPETAEMLAEMGNTLANGVFLAHLPSGGPSTSTTTATSISSSSPSTASTSSIMSTGGLAPPSSSSPSSSIFPAPATPTCSREAREAWIRAKYVDRRFARSQMPSPSVRKSRTCATLAEAATGGGIPRSASAVALDAHGEGPSTVAEDEAVAIPFEQRDDGEEAEIKWRKGGSPPSSGVSIRNNNVDSCEGEGTAEERHTKDYALALLPCSVKAAAAAGDLKAILTAIVEGADLEARVDGETALHVAVREGQTAATELLLLNGAKWNGVDDHGNTPLHVAAEEGKTLSVCQLLRRGADQAAVNAAGATPLQLAIDKVHADIVTIFRVHSMRDQFAEEFNNPMDETVCNVVSDITRKAGGRDKV